MNEKFVKTNVLAYELNPITLQRQWHLLKLVVSKNQWRDYVKLREVVLPDAVTCVQATLDEMIYLWLVPITVKLPEHTKLKVSTILFHRRHAEKIDDYLILQLLINRHNMLPATGPSTNQAKELLLITEQVPRATQCVTLAACLTRLNELVFRVKTYTKTDKSLEAEDMAIDWKRQVLAPHPGNSHLDRYRYGNRTGEHNTVGFANLVDVDELTQTKIHFAWTLLNKLQEFDADYFVRLPTFVASELMLPENPGLFPKNDIWRFFEGESINIVYQVDDPSTQKFAKTIATAINNSKPLGDLNISANIADSFSSGFHLQVVHDLKSITKNQLTDAYQIGSSHQWIQHVTIENFWSQKSSKATVSDPFNDAGMVKVMQELLVKRDLDRHQLHSMSTELLTTLSAYDCVTFLQGPDEDQIELFKMAVSHTGKIQITQRLIDLTTLSQSNVDEILCQHILNQLGTRSWSKWQWIDYVLCSGGDVLTVLTTQRHVMLDEPAIAELLAGGASNQDIDPNAVIEALQQLASNQEKSTDYHEVVEQLLEDMKFLPKKLWKMGQLKQHLKGTKSSPTKAKYPINFQKKVQKVVSADLYSICGLNFDASARRKADEANVLGLKGMGLTVIDGAYHYFVGTHQPLNMKVEKAVKFRKILPAVKNQQSVEFHYQKLQMMMAVGFVNNARYTVRPLQVKYLREFQARQLRLRQSEKTD